MDDDTTLYQYVHRSASELRDQIDELKTINADAKTRDIAITQCLNGITNLTSDIRSQVQNTAAHDQRKYNEILKGLNDHLQNVRLEVAPRRKFAFKPMPKAAPAAPALNASDDVQRSSSSIQSLDENLRDDDAMATGSTSSGPKSSSFTRLDNMLSLIPGSSCVDVSVVLADSKYCVVKCPVPTPSLTIKDMHKTVIVAGPVNGAAHVVRFTDSVLIVSSRQGITAPEGSQKNLWDQVKDFNWLKAGHSPNWSLLALEDQLGADQWKILQQLEEGDPVNTLLASFRVS
ncbi:MAG: hypothetical protein Q9224_000894 [Gallowayella concinna]